MKRKLPVCAVSCATCPWRPESPYAYLRESLEESAFTVGSRICHSTGGNNAIHRHTGKKPKICRGARDAQLRFFARIGFIDAPTDEAWEKKCRELKL